MSEKQYRDCMAEIIGVLKKHDMAGAVTVVAKDRAHFRYHFPTWSVVQLHEAPGGGLGVRLRSKATDFPSKEAQRTANELTAHIVYQMRDCALNTIGVCATLAEKMDEAWTVEHTPNADFDPERSQ